MVLIDPLPSLCPKIEQTPSQMWTIQCPLDLLNALKPVIMLNLKKI